MVTGQQNPEAAVRSLLNRPGAQTQWSVVKLGANGAMLGCKDAMSGAITLHQSPGFKVSGSGAQLHTHIHTHVRATPGHRSGCHGLLTCVPQQLLADELLCWCAAHSCT